MNDWADMNDDDFDDSFDDWPESPDDDDDGDDDCWPCPSCGVAVFDDAEQCPHCGDYITHGSSPWRGRSWWWVALGLLGLTAVVAALAGLY